MTRFEKIKQMSVEEMSHFLMDFVVEAFAGRAPNNVKEWLESEVEEE